MSTELSIINGYSRFWEELFIGSKIYIPIMNKQEAEKAFEPLDIEDIPQRRPLINEIAFSIFEKFCLKELDNNYVQNLNLDDTLLRKLHQEKLINLYEIIYLGRSFTHDLIEDELTIIKEMAQRLIKTFSDREGLKVSPTFAGCGIVHEARGDIYYKETLVEVKAGDRNFKSQDIRQLFIYGALNSKQQEPLDIKYFQLFNPRTGLIWEEEIGAIAWKIAGSSPFEVFNELIEFISSDYRSL
jgi:hypothetical protein